MTLCDKKYMYIILKEKNLLVDNTIYVCVCVEVF